MHQTAALSPLDGDEDAPAVWVVQRTPARARQQSPVASTIFVAFVGAVVLLLLMRLVGRISGRAR
jgi:hypothetical protein